MPEDLLNKATEEGILVEFCELPKSVLGYYSRTYLPPVILLCNKIRDNRRLLRVVLAEELGHHFNRACLRGTCNEKGYLQIKNKIEKMALWWATENLIPFGKLCEALNKKIFLTHELAEYFDVPDKFMGTALLLYLEKRMDDLIPFFNDRPKVNY